MTSRSDAFDLGAGLPGWVLRGLVAAVSATIMALLASAGIAGPALVLLGLAALLSVTLPASPAPALMVLLVAMSVVAIGGSPFAPRLLALVALLHLMHVSCGIAGLVPVTARIHVSALKRPAIRFAAIQAVVLGVAGVMAVAPTGRPPAVLELTAVAGIAVMAGLVIWLLNRAG